MRWLAAAIAAAATVVVAAGCSSTPDPGAHQPPLNYALMSQRTDIIGGLNVQLMNIAGAVYLDVSGRYGDTLVLDTGSTGNPSQPVGWTAESQPTSMLDGLEAQLFRIGAHQYLDVFHSKAPNDTLTLADGLPGNPAEPLTFSVGSQRTQIPNGPNVQLVTIDGAQYLDASDTWGDTLVADPGSNYDPFYKISYSVDSQATSMLGGLNPTLYDIGAHRFLANGGWIVPADAATPNPGADLAWQAQSSATEILNGLTAEEYSIDGISYLDAYGGNGDQSDTLVALPASG